MHLNLTKKLGALNEMLDYLVIAAQWQVTSLMASDFS